MGTHAIENIDDTIMLLPEEGVLLEDEELSERDDNTIVTLTDNDPIIEPLHPLTKPWEKCWAILVNITVTLVPKAFREAFLQISWAAITLGISFTFSLRSPVVNLLMRAYEPSPVGAAAGTLASFWLATPSNYFCTFLYPVSIALSQKVAWYLEQTRASTTAVSATDAEATDLEHVAEIVDTPLSRAKREIEAHNMLALIMAILVAIPPILLMVFAEPMFTHVFGQDSEVAALAQRYFNIGAFGILGNMGKVAFEQSIISFKKTGISAIVGIPIFILSVLLSIVLGFGVTLGPIVIPALGPEGIALGMVMDDWLGCIAYGLIVAFDKDCRQFNFFNFSLANLREHSALLISFIKQGFAMSTTAAMDIAIEAAAALISGKIGVVAQAAMSYCLQITAVASVFVQTFSIACVQRITESLGQGDYLRVRHSSLYGLATAFIWFAPPLIFFSVYPESLAYITGFVSTEVQEQVKTLLPLMSLGTLFDVVGYNMLQQTRAFDDYWAPIILVLTGMLSIIGFEAGLGLGTLLAVIGVGIGNAGGFGLMLLLVGLRWYYDLNKVAPSTTVVTELAVEDIERKPASKSCFSSCYGFFAADNPTRESQALITNSQQFSIDTDEDEVLYEQPEIEEVINEPTSTSCFSRLYSLWQNWWQTPATDLLDDDTGLRFS